MASERRQSPRYPTWLPGAVVEAEGGRPIAVRVVDLSLMGAAVEGALAVPAGCPLTLRVEWSGLAVTLRCRTIESMAATEFAITPLHFAETSEPQRVGLAALVGAMAAEFNDEQKRFATRPNQPPTILPFKRREESVRRTPGVDGD